MLTESRHLQFLHKCKGKAASISTVFWFLCASLVAPESDIAGSNQVGTVEEEPFEPLHYHFSMDVSLLSTPFDATTYS